MKLKNMVSALVAFGAMALMTVGVHAATYSASSNVSPVDGVASVDVLVAPSEGETSATVNGYVMTLTYDSTKVTPVVAGNDVLDEVCYATAGTEFADGVLVSDDITADETSTTKTLAVAWAGATPIEVTAETAMSTVKFNVVEGATGSTTIDVNVLELTSDGSAMAENGTYTVANGSIDISKVVWGDVNLNGAVDAGDASLISRYLANYVTLTEEQLTLGDVNNNSVVDSGDASNITRYLAGYIQSFPIEDAQQ